MDVCQISGSVGQLPVRDALTLRLCHQLDQGQYRPLCSWTSTPVENQSQIWIRSHLVIRLPLTRPDASLPYARLVQSPKGLSLLVSGVWLPLLNVFLCLHKIDGLTLRTPWGHFETMSNYGDRWP